MTPTLAIDISRMLAEKKEVCSVSLPAGLWQFADEHAKANHISRSAIIAHALVLLKLSVTQPDEAQTHNTRSVRQPLPCAPVS